MWPDDRLLSRLARGMTPPTNSIGTRELSTSLRYATRIPENNRLIIIIYPRYDLNICCFAIHHLSLCQSVAYSFLSTGNEGVRRIIQDDSSHRADCRLGEWVCRMARFSSSMSHGAMGAPLASPSARPSLFLSRVCCWWLIRKVAPFANSAFLPARFSPFP